MKRKTAITWIGCVFLLGAFAFPTPSKTLPYPRCETPNRARRTRLLADETGVGLPDPYREIPDWARLPPGRIWGHVFGVGVDSHGNVWVLDRCGAASCVGSEVAPIQEFNSSGKYIKRIGAGLFVFPHSLYVDKDDNIWVTDCGVKDGKGNQVFKLSPNGTVLMTLGKKGVLGGSPKNFYGPSDVAIGSNGDIFVTDGHAAVPLGGGAFYGHEGKGQGSYMRVVKFSPDGKFIQAWGREGTGQGEFNLPHGISIDSSGRVFVADRGNNRIEIFDQNGKFLGQWKQFGKPCGLFIDSKNNIYVSDSDSNKDLWEWVYSVDDPFCRVSASCVKRVLRPPDVGLSNPAFVQGIRIGSAKTGIVKAYIPPHMGPYGPTTITERLTVDAKGTVYLADSRTMNLRVYARK